ncbi:MAG: asparagine synthase (glutamine-hydrolyzing) [Candidatus Omnitrophica bacterium]|nr:asparagine synthase (glutamine-hydrolyzing) [Candidatus Omnitrophota bacterium]
MCGIAGVVEWGGRPIDPGLPARFCQALRHRGPDEEGAWVSQAAPGSREASVALAHARLSIIDLAGGRQPMASPDGALQIVFNGEIYNYRELRGELAAAGYPFRTHSDTEVILQAYAAFGSACVARLRGMFALALWDGPRRRLVLARDRAGKKPLVYAQRGDRIAFASELQALLQDPEVPAELDPSALHHYLTLLCIPAPWTAFTGIRKLPPGHLAIVEGGALRLERYWQPDPAVKRQATEREAARELRERLEESVRLRLISDVPVGAFLSGGLDSSIVVATMASVSPEPVQTFSIGFAESSFNELPFARRVAARYRTRHTEFLVTPDAAAVMPRLIRHYGEPFADSSAVPTYYVAECARQFVKVVLSGDGGDELFGGYNRHLAMRWADRYHRLPRPVRAGLFDPMWRHWPEWLDVRLGTLSLRRFLRGLPLSRRERMVAWMEGFDEAAKRRLCTEDRLASLNGANTLDYLDPLWGPVQSLDGVDALTWVDFQWYLPNDLLVKVDIAAMAHGLEVRSPWLDHPLVEFAMRLPARFKVRGRALKYLPRRAWGRELPPEVLRHRKQGFAVPLAAWLRGPLQDWMRDLVGSPQARSRGLFEPRMVERLVEEHAAGRKDWSQQLWALMMLELWFRWLRDARQTSGAEMPAGECA